MADDFTLYPLFPLILRIKSLLADGLTEESDSQWSVLRKIVYALDEVFGETELDIEGLTHLLDPDTCPTSYFNFLVDLIDGFVNESWNVQKRREVIKSIVFIWLIKGTKLSLDAKLRLDGLDNFLPIELWKTIIYEVLDYSRTRDYTHQIKAARVEFVANDGIGADQTETADRDAALAKILPIHVRPFSFDSLGGVTNISDALGTFSETFTFDETTPGLVETAAGLSDSLEVVETCVATCETSCQAASEYACLGTCETSCEAICQASCQVDGQVVCSAVSCQWSCQAACQSGPCETSTETGL